ncbi:MAG: hypothetical protein RR280_08450 [Bacteroidaceae bacterium]
MKAIKIVCFAAVVCIIVSNIVLLIQYKKIQQQIFSLSEDKMVYVNMLKENSLNQNTVLRKEINAKSFKMILRYNKRSCSVCIRDGLSLLENVYTKERLYNELLVVGDSALVELFQHYKKVNINSEFTPLDQYDMPYVCFLNEQNSIIFSLVLRPENYEQNRNILLNYNVKN